MSTVTEERHSFPLGNGYEFIETYRRFGWRAIPSWGRDGWDLGSWPLVVVLLRNTAVGERRRYELAYYVEGDVTVWLFAKPEEREAKVNELAWFHWRWEGAPWIAGVPEGDEPAELKGPYRR